MKKFIASKKFLPIKKCKHGIFVGLCNAIECADKVLVTTYDTKTKKITQKEHRVLRSKAFTLLEVIITGVIIGVLAMFVLPSFLTMTSTADKVNAANKLKVIYSGQQDYYSNHGVYMEAGNKLSDCLYRIDGNSGIDNCVFDHKPLPTEYTCHALECKATNTAWVVKVMLDQPLATGNVPRRCDGYANPCLEVL